MPQKIIILDFGSQTTQLIGRRVRELNTYCEIVPYNKYPADDSDVIGVIVSGSPFSVYDEKAFSTELRPIAERHPLLGICYGAQLLAYQNGGTVESAPSREYGRAILEYVDPEDPLFAGIKAGETVWMSHGDTITRLPEDFRIIASTDSVACGGFRVDGKQVWGVQFHPEVFHSSCGTALLANFVNGICGSRGEWSAENYIETTVAALREQLGDDRVVLGLSGGVDSSVAAVLINRAIGDRLTCIFVDHGMLRKDEFRKVLDDYRCLGLNVIG
ncbi:MAG: glutamine-hydrolyzing GMP synthase, partial [Muribaculaceae bacterium]|nr:glutamine-hydrolyzing GMP synthase [Muribaculaceae bacterium]